MNTFSSLFSSLGISRILFSCFLLLNVNLSFAQSLEARLSRSVPNCEIISTNSQNLLSSYSLNDLDSIQAVLKIWKRECGNTEPIQRLEILLDINEGAFSSTNYKFYLKNHIYKFENRVQDSNYEDNYDRYESNKSYYNYVKLEGKYDKWTRAIAQELISLKLNTHSEEYLILLLFSGQVEAFDEAMLLNENQNLPLVVACNENRYANSPVYYQWTAHVGLWAPLGKLREHFNPSPQLGFGVNVSFKKKYSIGLEASFTRWLNQKELDFNFDDRSVTTKSNHGMTIGATLAREVLQYHDNAFIDLYSGINVAILSTDIEKENATEDDKYHSTTTANLELGLNLRKRIFTSKEVGINLAVNYSPYNLDSQLKTKVGSLYFQSNAFLRF